MRRLRRLVARRDARDAEGVFVVEGVTLVQEAVASGASIEAIYVAPGAAIPEGLPDSVAVVRFAPGVMERVASTVTPQPVLAVVAQRPAALSDLSGPGPVVVCVDVRDPGNLGTVLRSAEASEAAGVVCCDGTVDAYNPKCVRASAGAVMRLPVVVGGEAVTVLAALRVQGRRRLATVASGGVAYDREDLAAPVALVMGNESSGLPIALDNVVDGRVEIPMAASAESLNVGVACAVLCFEAARQRRSRG